jgi:ABC-2 type transport system ATP-binding protein
MLKVSALSKRYREHWAVRDVHLDIAPGEAVGLLGANGAGKSTLIKCILSLVRRTAGDVVLTEPYAYLPEQPQLPPSLSALSLLTFKCRANHIPAEQGPAALAEVRLSDADIVRPLRQYSKGMRQRASLAFALCGEPGLIVLDEPMSGLDALGRAEMLDVFKRHKARGAAILMSSHIVSDMVQVCDRVLVMAHGRICEEVTVMEHSLAEAKALESRLAHWTEEQS